MNKSYKYIDMSVDKFIFGTLIFIAIVILGKSKDRRIPSIYD